MTTDDISMIVAILMLVVPVLVLLVHSDPNEDGAKGRDGDDLP